jgi:hypothetical protein
MNTFIYSNSVAVIEKDGKRLISSIKPIFSFSYDEVQFHQSSTGYVNGGNFIEFTDVQSAEVAAYIESVSEDVALGGAIKENNDNLIYLTSTDWMMVREIETGVLMPADIKLKRAEARAAITTIE